MLPKPFKIDPKISHKDLTEIIRSKLKNYLVDTNLNIVEGFRRDLIVIFETQVQRNNFFKHLWNMELDLHPRIKQDYKPCVLGIISQAKIDDRKYINTLIDKLRIENYPKSYYL